MLLRTPNFYPKFHCIADKCTDTCCIGWEIDIDKNSMERYKNVKGEFGDKLRASIHDGCFALKEGDRCSLLNSCGLCELIINLGEEALCDICREHPRFVEVYGDVMEKGIGLCCEEGARLLLCANSKSKTDNLAPVLEFTEGNINEPEDELPDDAREARDAIFLEREDLFHILEQRNIPLNKRLLMLLEYVTEENFAHESSNKNDSTSSSRHKLQNAWIKLLGKGESYGTEWDKAYERIVQNGWSKEISAKSIFTDEDGAKIVAYMLFRYYAKSLFDGDSLGKVQFAIFFWTILKEFGAELAGSSQFADENDIRKNSTKLDPRITALKLLSKQIEYSDEVMNLLARNFIENEAFSIEAFFKILE